MFEPRKKAALRRLRIEQLITKMEQIERQAALTLDEHPNGHPVERQRLIMAIARQVHFHLIDQLEAGEREPQPQGPKGTSHLRVIKNRR
ncbi:MAG: hypothetical protein A3G81_28315 [Betaproteobacteria bacterium RIFCSPLOWO2_12_FULL_65_14]|nr:MAG: hypothetical protein A3G81_28315 [Betaproteobacteria bacterium RIFCSPLOWO2_12_FULL_65_14]